MRKTICRLIYKIWLDLPVFMIKKTIYTLTLLLCGLTASAFAQNVREKAVSRLTNDSSKQWIFERVEVYMAGERCLRGEKWKFSKDGLLTIIKCVKGIFVETEKRWTLEVKSRLDVIVNIEGDSPYTLLFPQMPRNSAKEKMILRIKALRRTEQTKDLIFYYEVD
jgi:hypothetical protein